MIFALCERLGNIINQDNVLLGVKSVVIKQRIMNPKGLLL